MAVWEIAYCEEHIELWPEGLRGPRVECERCGLTMSGYVCHRCSCFTCNAIKARHRWLYPPKVYQLALDL